jgi:putative phage-type endonuclease
MKVSLANVKETAMIKSACTYFADLETINPLPSHQSYLEEWKGDQEDICDFGEKEDEVSSAILTFRETLFKASFECVDLQIKTPITDWEWLLTVEQMPQRTEEWYTQKSRLLTASEISALWRSVKSRNALVLSKVYPQINTSKRIATLKSQTSPMDWGVRYEPVVKLVLEKELNCKITDLGRIYHRTISCLAASPDGIITEGPSELKGSLIEIKCPSSRIITDDIPFDYWCQMQIQMEVCGIDRCEYVEMKFKEGESIENGTSPHIEAGGWITLDINKTSEEMKYQYHTGIPIQEEGWISVETYPWTVLKMRRTTVHRDKDWFNSSVDSIYTFWKDVDSVKNGSLTIEGPKKRKPAVVVTDELPDRPMFQTED